VLAGAFGCLGVLRRSKGLKWFSTVLLLLSLAFECGMIAVVFYTDEVVHLSEQVNFDVNALKARNGDRAAQNFRSIYNAYASMYAFCKVPTGSWLPVENGQAPDQVSFSCEESSMRDFANWTIRECLAREQWNASRSGFREKIDALHACHHAMQIAISNTSVAVNDGIESEGASWTFCSCSTALPPFIRTLIMPAKAISISVAVFLFLLLLLLCCCGIKTKKGKKGGSEAVQLAEVEMPGEGEMPPHHGRDGEHYFARDNTTI